MEDIVWTRSHYIKKHQDVTPLRWMYIVAEMTYSGNCSQGSYAADINNSPSII